MVFSIIVIIQWILYIFDIINAIHAIFLTARFCLDYVRDYRSGSVKTIYETIAELLPEKLIMEATPYGASATRSLTRRN